jgi:hypothetical protein
MSTRAPSPAGQQWLLLAALALSGTALAAASNPNSKNSLSYRWVDEQGVIHYGDRVPPQYSQKQQSVLNSQGVEVKRLDAQKTPEELAAENRQLQEAIRLKQHDSFLMTTYTSVKDIESLRDERLEQMKAQRTAAEQYVESLHSRLSALQARALVFRPYNAKPGARRMPDDLAEDLVRTLNEMRTQSSALAAKGQEETALKEQFQADIERYRELHVVHAQR